MGYSGQDGNDNEIGSIGLLGFSHTQTSDAGDIITANFLDFPPNFRLRTRHQYCTTGNGQRRCPFPRCLELISGPLDLSFAPFGRSGQMTHASSRSQPKIWRKIQKIGGDNITSITPFLHVCLSSFKGDTHYRNDPMSK